MVRKFMRALVLESRPEKLEALMQAVNTVSATNSECARLGIFLIAAFVVDCPACNGEAAEAIGRLLQQATDDLGQRRDCLEALNGAEPAGHG